MLIYSFKCVFVETISKQQRALECQFFLHNKLALSAICWWDYRTAADQSLCECMCMCSWCSSWCCLKCSADVVTLTLYRSAVLCKSQGDPVNSCAVVSSHFPGVCVCMFHELSFRQMINWSVEVMWLPTRGRRASKNPLVCLIWA